MKERKVCDYLGQIVTVSESGWFRCKVGGKKFESLSLDELKSMVKKELNTRVNIEAIYSTGEMELATIITLIDGYRGINGVLDSNHLGCGVPHQTEIENLYPLTEKNKQLFKEHTKMRDAGWKLINKADEMYEELEKFPKDFFKKVVMVKEGGE